MINPNIYITENMPWENAVNYNLSTEILIQINI